MNMDMSNPLNGFNLLLSMFERHFTANTINAVERLLISVSATERRKKQAELLQILDETETEEQFLKAAGL